jgi:sulfopyruvate decarboxylase TPP-binding subunit
VIEQQANVDRPRHDLSFSSSGGRYRQDTTQGLYDGLKAAGIDFVVFLPDSSLDGIEKEIQDRGEIKSYVCTREDEGIAMAMGAHMVGRRPAVLMEAAGLGLSALILARSIVQRCPMLLIAGHTSTLGERYDFHSTARMVAEPLLRALGVPYHVVMDPAFARTAVVEGQHTVNGQKVPFAVLLPPHVVWEIAS